MKIRADFVTNSSSVSYILTMNEEIADVFLELYRRNDVGLRPVIVALKNWMKDHGEIVDIEGHALYTAEVTFRTDGDCIFLDEITKGKPVNEVNFSSLSDDEMMSLIFGMILEGQMQFRGFGATQVKTF